MWSKNSRGFPVVVSEPSTEPSRQRTGAFDWNASTACESLSCARDRLVLEPANPVGEVLGHFLALTRRADDVISRYFEPPSAASLSSGGLGRRPNWNNAATHSAPKRARNSRQD